MDYLDEVADVCGETMEKIIAAVIVGVILGTGFGLWYFNLDLSFLRWMS